MAITDKQIFRTEIECIKRRSSGLCNGGTDCCSCELLMNENDIISAYERAINASETINRLKADNERLEKVQVQYVKAYLDEFVARLKNDFSLTEYDNDSISEIIDELAATVKDEFSTLADFTALIKAEGRKEFVEELKKHLYYPYDEESIDEEVIDDILEEMERRDEIQKETC